VVLTKMWENEVERERDCLIGKNEGWLY